MNPFVIIFRAPFVMLEAAWEILLMLVETVLLAYALTKSLVVLVMQAEGWASVAQCLPALVLIRERKFRASPRTG